MKPIRLIHWNEEEARARVAQLEAAGFRAEFDALSPPDLFRRLKSDPPGAIVIDLTRLPSHGREVATALRGLKSTRHIPLVFAEGDPEKVERIRALLPDAVYTSWSRIRRALNKALAHPLGALPEGASLQDGLAGRFQVLVWFVRSVDDLRRGIARVAARLGGATLWVAWPKRTSGIRTDLTQQLVRDSGLDLGLVDYKTCAIDATWSGLAFVRRKG